MENVLLHACCAPCSIECVRALREEGANITLYWNNPNIHPFTEYKHRKEALVGYAQAQNLPLVDDGAYGLRRFLAHAGTEYKVRCVWCYRERLQAAAAYAAQHGYAAFSTTLLISPYQDHDLLHAIGQELATEHGVAFLYRDFRPFFRNGQKKARELGLYMQKYCGCIFSEEERYTR